MDGKFKLQKQISRLEADMQSAVARQDFESAARIRDELKELKGA